MQPEFPATRADALARLEAFEKKASRYSGERNFVIPGHTNVSRLSPAIRHRLLDADPASNTLSWRWVAGLQTPGKTYLARRSNIEKYLHAELLTSEGLTLLENGKALTLDYVSRPAITSPELDSAELDTSLSTGFWMHEEDYCAESLFSKDEFKGVFVTSEPVKSETKKAWIKTAKNDASTRCRAHFNVPVSEGQLKELISWAKENSIQQVVTMRPDAGPINDQLHRLKDVKIIFKDRAEDVLFRPLAKAGFFGFWKKIEPLIKGSLD